MRLSIIEINILALCRCRSSLLIYMLLLLCQCINANFQFCVVFKRNLNCLKNIWVLTMFVSVEITFVSSLLLFLLPSAWTAFAWVSFFFWRWLTQIFSSFKERQQFLANVIRLSSASICHESAIFSFELIKVCLCFLCHDLLTRMESVQLITWNWG